MGSTHSHHLYSIRMSNYNERARFALDLAKIYYVEHPHMPAFHGPTTFYSKFMAGGTIKEMDHVTSTPMSTPMLILNDGKTILHDSKDIVIYANSFLSDNYSLYPSTHKKEIDDFEKYMHDELGVQARTFAYYYILDDPQITRKCAWKNVGWYQATTFSLFAWPIYVSACWLLGVTKESGHASVDKISEILQKVSEKLTQNGGNYLVGDRFTAADLTFASLASIALGITHENGYGAYWPGLDDMTSAARDLVTQWRQTPAGQHALKVYKEHRKKPVNECEPIMHA